MRRLAQSALGALLPGTQVTQHIGSSRTAATADPCFRRWWSASAATSAASRGTSGAASSDSTGSPWSPFSAVMFIPSMVCGCLAYWQYERMQWKEELIHLREGIATAEARDVFAGPLHEYDKVQVRGRFLHEYSLYVGPRPRSVPGSGIQPGYFVITPMINADRKGVVLVNRGWVPTSWKQEAEARAAAKLKQTAAEAREKEAAAAAAPSATTTTAAAASPPRVRRWWSWFGGAGGGKFQALQQQQQAELSQPSQLAKEALQPEVVVGVVQYDEQPSNFMPDNRPEAEEFHFIQREAMARVLGLPPDTPLVMAISSDPSAVQTMQKRSPLEEARSAAAAATAPDAGPAPAYPAPKHVADLVRFSTMPGDHRNYALIWATLCVTLALMARTAVTKPLRGPRIVDAPGNSARDAWKASQAS